MLWIILAVIFILCEKSENKMRSELTDEWLNSADKNNNK